MAAVSDSPFLRAQEFFSHHLRGSDLPPKLYAHIHSDTEILGSDHEGHESSVTAPFLQQCLGALYEKHRGSDAGDPILRLLRLMDHFFTPRDGEELYHKLSTLRAGEEVLVKGGWQSSGSHQGHAILYLFKRNREDTLTATLFNTGGGTDTHHHTEQRDGKTLISPTVAVTKPSAFFSKEWCEHLTFFQQADWSYKLYDLNRNKESLFHHRYGNSPEDLIYTCLFPDSTKTTSPLMTPQRSGTCSWRAFLALAKKELPEKTYKLFKLHIKYATLLHFHRGHLEHPLELPSAESRFLLETSARKLLRSVAKLYKPARGRPLISLEETRYLIHGVRDVLHSVSNIVSQFDRHSSHLPRRATPRSLDFDRRGREDAPSVTRSSLRPVTAPRISPETVSQTVLELARIPLQYPADEHIHSYNIEQLARALPGPNSGFWERINAREYPQLIEGLHHLIEIYVRNNHNDCPTLFEKRCILLVLLASMHKVTSHIRHPRIDIGQFPLYQTLFSDETPTMTRFTPQSIQEWMAYTDKWNDKGLFEPGKIAPLYVLLLNTDSIDRGAFLSIDQKIKAEFPEASPQWQEQATFFLYSFSPGTMERENLQHIHHLREATLLCGSFFKMPETVPEGPLRFCVDIPSENRVEYGFSLVQGRSDYMRMGRVNFRSGISTSTLSAAHRKGGKDAIKDDYFDTSTLLAGEKSEGGALVRPPRHTLPGAKKLASRLVTRPVRFSETLSFFSRHLMHLTNPNWQTLFDLWMFAEKDFPQLQREAQKPAFVSQCNAFIRQGLTFFFPPETTAYPVLFFIRFALHLRKAGAPIRMPNLDALFDSLLKNRRLSPEEIYSTHLHRLYALSEHPEPTPDTMAQAVESWMYCSNFSGDINWEEPHLLYLGRSYIYSITPLIMESPPLQQEIAQRTLHLLRIRGDLHHIEGRNGNITIGDHTTVHLLSGGVSSLGKPVSPGSTFHLRNDPQYIRLFGDALFEFVPDEGWFEWRDPKGDLYRCRKPSPSAPLHLEKRIGGSWYRYLSTNEVDECNIPLLFNHDFACFFKVEQEEHRYYGGIQKYTFHFAPLSDKADENHFQIEKIGRWREAPTFWRVDRSGERRLELNLATVSGFEKDIFALITNNEHLTFPRYYSLYSKTPLTFRREGGEWVASHIRESRFTIQRRAQEDPFAARGFVNYLSLKNERGQQKIVIPFKRATKKGKLLTSPVGLDLDDKYRRYADRVQAEFGAFSYFEYDVDPDSQELKAQSIEGELFKIYLHLLHRDYLKAYELLKHIPPHIELSEESKTILGWITNCGDDIRDHSPKAVAVRLKAAYYLTQRRESCLGVVRQELKLYNEVKKNIPLTLRLTPKEYAALTETPFEEHPTDPLPAHPPLTPKLPVDAALRERFEIRETPPTIPHLAFPPLPPSQERYEGVFAQLDRAFLEELEKAPEKRELHTTFALAERTTFGELREELQGRQRALQHRAEQELGALLELNQRGPSVHEHADALMQDLDLLGEKKVRLSFNRLLSFFLIGDARNYHNANPMLTPENIRELEQRIENYLHVQLQIQQLTRALCTMALEHPQDQIVDRVGREMLREIDVSSRALIVFQYLDNLALRPNQIVGLSHLLEQEAGHFVDATLQLLMGEGKTSVLASMWLFNAAQNPERLATFIVPCAQFDSVSKQVVSMQHRRFKQEVYPVHISHATDDLSTEKLSRLYHSLIHLKQVRGAFVTTRETIQILEHEFLKHCSIALAHMDEAWEAKHFYLSSLLKLFANEGDFLIDESDVLLTPFLEINKPVGTSSLLPFPHIELVKQIFSYHASDDIMVEGKPIDAWIDLKHNQQGALPTSFYEERIQPKIAEQLCRRELSFIPPQHRATFVRYACGQINHEEAEHNPFVIWLNGQAKGDDTMREQARRIALVKLFFVHILPHTLSRSTQQHYGRAFGVSTGKVVPFEAVDTPAQTEFGNPWVAVAYHFQTVLSTGISLEQLEQTIQSAKNGANIERKKNPKLRLDQTESGRHFFNKTGRRLSALLQSRRAVEDLHRALIGDIDLTLAVEAEAALQNARFYPSFFYGNPHNFVSRLGSVNTFSGTPTLAACYGKDLGRNLYLDSGSEGAIVAHMLAHFGDNLHTLEECTPESFLEPVIRKGETGTLHSLIDAGGLLKDFDNLTVARRVARRLHAAGSPVEYVLYFGRYPEDSSTPDSLMAIKVGSDRPIYLGSTTAAKQLGIKPRNSFMFYDERHCYATDWTQPGSATGVCTLSPYLDLSSWNQANLRLRGFFREQQLEYIVMAKEKPLFLNGGATLLDCVHTAHRNLCKMKSDAFLLATKQRIQNHLRAFAFKKILAAPVEEIGLLFTRAQELFTNTMSVDPFEICGQVEESVVIEDDLNTCAQGLLHAAERLCTPEEIDRLGRETRGMIASALEQNLLPAHTLSQSVSTGLQVTMEMEIKAEIEMELKTELERYLSISALNPRDETRWTEREIGHMLQSFTAPQEHDVKRLTTYLEAFNYDQPYHRIFSDRILATKNWEYTTESKLPIFHSAHKKAGQLLFFKNRDGKMYCLLLSVDEAAAFKAFLDKRGAPNAALYLVDGTKESSNPARFTEEDLAQMQEILLKVNMLDGNTPYLYQHDEDLKALLNKDEFDDGLALRYMKLRVEGEPENKEVFYSFLLHQFPSFQLTASDVPRLTPAQLRQLGTVAIAPLIDYVTLAQIKGCPEFLVPLLPRNRIKKLPPALLRYLTPHQIKRLGKAEVKKIPAQHLHHIEKHLTRNQKTWLTNAAGSRITQKKLKNLSHIDQLRLQAAVLRELYSVFDAFIMGFANFFHHIFCFLLYLVPFKGSLQDDYDTFITNQAALKNRIYTAHGW